MTKGAVQQHFQPGAYNAITIDEVGKQANV